MNIEDFFLERYKQLEQENEELKKKLSSLNDSNCKYGVFATNEELKALNISCKSYYSIFESSWSYSKIANYSVQNLKKFISSTPDVYINMGLIEIDRKTFIGEIKIVDLDTSKTFHISAKDDNLETVSSIDDVKSCGEDWESFLGQWCTEDCQDYLLSAAIDEIDGHIRQRIEELEKKENDNG